MYKLLKTTSDTRVFFFLLLLLHDNAIKNKQNDKKLYFTFENQNGTVKMLQIE